MVMQDAVWLSVVDRAPAAGACELCGAEPATLEAVAVIRHAHGGTAEFIACGRCARALRRVLAAIGGDGRIVGATAAPTATRTRGPSPAAGAAPAVVARTRARPRSRVLQSEVLLEYAEVLVTPDGTSYVARACGGPRADGTWVGWLEFAAAGQTTARRTGQETSQPNRDALAYWASGLEPVYLQGAFARAR